MRHTVLLLIDLQNDFLNRHDIEPHANLAIEKLSELLEGCRHLFIPVVHVRLTASEIKCMPHWKQPLDQSKPQILCCIEGTKGHEFPEKLKPLESEKIIDKTFFSAFSTPELSHFLKSIHAETLIIAGAYLHGCVRTTAIDAYSHGYKVLIADDACLSNDPLHAAMTRRYLEGRTASFLSVDTFLKNTHFPKKQHEFINISPKRSHSIEERIDVLTRLSRVLEENASFFALQIVKEVGKPLKYAKEEVSRAVAMIKATLSRGADLKEITCDEGHVIRYRPLGKIAIITPWNNPLAIPIGKIAPAIFYGNTVVWKPSPAAEKTATLLIELLRKNGMPEGFIDLLCGDHATAKALMEHQRIDGVTFSGSLTAGYVAQEICTRRHIRLQAELGGNNAAIVWRDTDLLHAAKIIAEAAFGFAGQRCTATSRVVLDATCTDEFLSLLTKATRQLQWGDPFYQDTDIGPVIHEEKCLKLKALLDRSKDDLAFISTPHPSLTLPNYFPPTIVICNHLSAEIVQEENFGPILVIQEAKDFNHAITLCNGVKYGLTAALFSNSKELHHQFLEKIDVGMLHINTSTTDIHTNVPFGGWKKSMIGSPEHGIADREFYTKTQTIAAKYDG